MDLECFSGSGPQGEIDRYGSKLIKPGKMLGTDAYVNWIGGGRRVKKKGRNACDGGPKSFWISISWRKADAFRSYTSVHKPLVIRKGVTIANCDFTVSGSAGLALRSSVIETTGNRMQMTHSKASSAVAVRRASARASREADERPAQNSSRVAAIPAHTRLRISSKVVCFA